MTQDTAGWQKDLTRCSYRAICWQIQFSVHKFKVRDKPDHCHIWTIKSSSKKKKKSYMYVCAYIYIFISDMDIHFSCCKTSCFKKLFCTGKCQKESWRGSGKLELYTSTLHCTLTGKKKYLSVLSTDVIYNGKENFLASCCHDNSPP